MCTAFICIIKVRRHLHANTNEAGRGEAYVNICLDCNTRQNVVIHGASEWFSLKCLHCYTCFALACLAHVFVLMWTRLIGASTSACEHKTRQAEVRHMRTYALIATRGKMLSFTEPVNDSLWSTDSRWIAFVQPQTKQMQFSSPRLHVYIATLASPGPASCVFLS